MIVGAYYYVWFPKAFGNTTIEPRLGFYNSKDPAVIAQHVKWFKQASLDFVAISWWGIKSEEEQATQAFVRNTNFPFAIMAENNPSPQVITQENIDYAYSIYASRPQYLKISGKPVLFLYSSPYYWNDPRWTIIYIDGGPVNRPGTGPRSRQFLEAYPGYYRPDGPLGRYGRSVPLFAGRILRNLGRNPLMITTFNDFYEEDAIEPSKNLWGEQYLNTISAIRGGASAGLGLGLSFLIRELYNKVTTTIGS